MERLFWWCLALAACDSRTIQPGKVVEEILHPKAAVPGVKHEKLPAPCAAGVAANSETVVRSGPGGAASGVLHGGARVVPLAAVVAKDGTRWIRIAAPPGYIEESALRCEEEPQRDPSASSPHSEAVLSSPEPRGGLDPRELLLPAASLHGCVPGNGFAVPPEANVRAAPGARAKILRRMARGESIELLGFEPGTRWVRVRHPKVRAPAQFAHASVLRCAAH